MARTLNYQVAVFNAVVATFNSVNDAQDWARSQSVKYPTGWVEVRDSADTIHVAYKNSSVVHGFEYAGA